MRKKIFWTLLIVAILICSYIAYYLIVNLDNKTVSETLKISLIASFTAIISIVGSVFVNQHLTNENSKQQRDVEIRKIKQEFYHKFSESFLLKLTYSMKIDQNKIDLKNPDLSNPDVQKYLEADRIFCLEKNRLPLYASQELVELVESVAKGADVNFSKLYSLIRKDLCNNDFLEFKDLNEISLTLPMI